MIWRDLWDGMPAVVILAEEGAQDGVIEDAVLFLFERPPGPVTVTDAAGQRLRVLLPENLPDGAGLYPGLDLPVETPNEDQQTDPDHPLS